MKIAVFDSGIGGITVLRELRRRFPSQDFVYLGDTANVPYGTKSPGQIRTLAREAAATLRRSGSDLLIVACNTASCLAMSEIREVMESIPVFGVVEAGVAATVKAREASAAGSYPNILVFGTRATIRSRVYSTLLRERLGAITVLEQECPLLVPMIEEGWVDHPILKQTVAEYVRPHRALPPGIALLGCTHYPWIKPVFEEALPGWRVIESSSAIAESLASAIPTEAGAAREGSVEWIFTDALSIDPLSLLENGGKAMSSRSSQK